MDSALEASAIGRKAGDLWLLREVSLKVSPGERLGVVGNTGSGKTLLLRALALLDPVDQGEVHWQGQAVRGNAVPAFRSRVMYLHQSPALIEGTVEDNLRLPFTLGAHQGHAFSLEATLTHLQRVGRGKEFLNRSTRDLSGGEAQMVALLRAIALEPLVLLLDEPTAALDEENTRTIEELVSAWFDNRKPSGALVWVSHNNGQVARMTDRVVTMEDGVLS